MRADAPPVPFAGVVLLLFASTALRLPGIFLYPSFWAEDLTIFFKQSLELGPAALGQPVYGSYHTLPRLIALVASLAPVAWAPALFALGAGLVSSASLALFSRPGFRWLVPRDEVRLLACWLFGLLPGATECFFALCTSNYALFAGVLFLLLERDEAGRWRMGIRRALLVSFLWFSLGQGLVLAPLLALLYWLTRNRNYLLGLGALGLAVFLNVAATPENTYRPPEWPGLSYLALVYFDNLFVRLAFVPLAGRWIARVWALRDASFFLISAALLGGYLYTVTRKRTLDREGAGAIAVAVLATMAQFPLIALARDYGVDQLRRPTMRLEGRYALVPSILGVVLLAAWLTRPARSRWARASAVALLLWSLTNLLLFEPFYQQPWPSRPFVWEWPRQRAMIEQALRDRRAGRLAAPVVVKDIHGRPDLPQWKVTVVISP
jgi:hypothetical protein